MISFSRLKDIREDADLSQEKMAEILGIKRSTYSLWELGINIIPLRYLSLYADYFNCSIDYILSLSNDKETNSFIKGLDLYSLGENLKLMREHYHLSQENVADMLGVTQACIAKYEKGLICISTSNLYKFSKEFDISMNYLCGKTRFRIVRE